MMFDLHPPPPAPPPRLAILSGLLLCALFLFGGALQHDLWKVDDAVNLGLAYSVAQGHWLAPQLDRRDLRRVLKPRDCAGHPN